MRHAKSTKAKGPSAEEKRFRAKSAAYRIAEANGIDPDTVQHMVDTDYNRMCFVVTAIADRATIVYDDDPDCKFNILNRPGRLVPEQEGSHP
jgi:hypothetical protein